jgi:hypothetical protein
MLWLNMAAGTVQLHSGESHSGESGFNLVVMNNG